MDKPIRKPTRIPGYDYSSLGAYFITFCTENRRCILSNIAVGEGLDPPGINLTVYGKVVEEQIRCVSDRFSTATIEKYVIMPNHVHLLIVLGCKVGGTSPSPTVIDVVRTIKSLSAHICKTNYSLGKLWQRSFHDHIIRNENDYLEIWNYIDSNSAKWHEDKFYIE